VSLVGQVDPERVEEVMRGALGGRRIDRRSVAACRQDEMGEGCGHTAVGDGGAPVLTESRGWR